MKLLFESLDALLVELRDRGITIVRVSPTLAVEPAPGSGGQTHLVARVLVTGTLGDQSWAEWRHRVGHAPVDGGAVERPAWLRERQDRALAQVSRHVDEAGFLIREGILTHDRGVMDTFRL